jgi:phosphoribosylanthranilate isomerase
MTKVKICGLTNLEDAQLSAKFGADALGFNFYPKSPRYILPETAREIIEQLPAEILKVGVFVNESLEKIAEIAQTAKLDALQLHGEETPEFAKELKLKTNLEIIKAFRVSPDFKPEDVLQYEVDAILLDAYNPKEHGGTGETFDWEIAKKVQGIFPRMYLAGGLKHENIENAIWSAKPLAVDVCSGVESEKGKKDKIKLINFVTKTKSSSKEVQDDSIYNLLTRIHLKPALFLGTKSVLRLKSFLDGYGFALASKETKCEWKDFLEFNFYKFVEKYFNWNKLSLNSWETIILKECNDDEEKALDLFFALLEEFKLENEADSTNPPKV